MNFLALSIESLVPHRGPMCWIDRLLAADEDNVTVDALVSPDHPLAQAGGVPGWTGIEFMAQTIAVWAGIRAMQRGEPIKPGFLLGSRQYQCTRPYFHFGERLTIEVHRELFGDNGLGMFSCRILVGDESVANANVSVFEPPDPQAFLEKMSQ